MPKLITRRPRNRALAARLKELKDRFEDRLTSAAEARACGHEIETFEDWSGQTSPRARAETRWQEHYDDDTLDLY